MPDGDDVPEFHPFAQLFPLMEESQLNELAADIRRNGLKFPAIEYDGQIIDGRNRYFACRKAGVPFRTVVYTGSDPLEFVIAANLKRRHLNESQRALVAARLANMPVGRPRKDKSANDAISQADAAAQMNVSRREVQRAIVVRDKAVPEIIARVDRGEVRVDTAAKIATLPPDVQRRLAEEPPKALVGAAKRIAREEKLEALRQPIAEAAAELDAPQQLYPVLVADPPWKFEPYSRETGMDRAADNHYPTMTVEEIAALKIPAAKDAVLFLWATAPMLTQALWVMKAWDFSYRSHMIWLKSRVGTGYWFRNQHELLLVGTKGNIPAPTPGSQYNSVHSQASAKHSEKPPIFYEIVEDMFPGLSHCELFARERRLGWASWGAELSQKMTQDASDDTKEGV